MCTTLSISIGGPIAHRLRFKLNNYNASCCFVTKKNNEEKTVGVQQTARNLKTFANQIAIPASCKHDTSLGRT